MATNFYTINFHFNEPKKDTEHSQSPYVRRTVNSTRKRFFRITIVVNDKACFGTDPDENCTGKNSLSKECVQFRQHASVLENRTVIIPLEACSGPCHLQVWDHRDYPTESRHVMILTCLNFCDSLLYSLTYLSHLIKLVRELSGGAY